MFDEHHSATVGPLNQETAMRLLVVSVLVVIRRHYQQQTCGGAPPSATGALRSGERSVAAVEGTLRPARVADAAAAAPRAERVAPLAEQASTARVSLSDLPAGAHTCVCAFLGAADLNALAATSRELREAATDERLWAALDEARFGGVRRQIATAANADRAAPTAAPALPSRLRYWSWQQTWRTRVLASQHGDIWSADPMLLVHGRFLRAKGLINDHPGGAELLGGAMRLGRDVGDLFEMAGHAAKARHMLATLEVVELRVPELHAPLAS